MTRSKLIVAALGLAMCAPLAMGQENAGGGGGREGGRQRGEGQGQWGGGERPSFEQMRERMNQQLKEDLKATDEEWQAIQPAIEKVQRLQMQSRGGFGWGGGRRGGPGGGAPGADAPSNPVSDATRNLQQALEDQNTSAEVLKQRLDALRAAREKARAELTAAQGELRELLTVRQEAVLVSRGTLE